MKIGRIVNILLLFATCTMTSCVQNKMSIPKEFVETVPPKPGSADWYPLNNSQNEFGVSIVNGNLTLKKVSEINRTELKITGGTLIGIDRGEWGGQLIFKPTDAGKEDVKIKNGNIKFIFTFKGKIYFVEGLAHESFSSGAIFELVKTNDKFTFNKKVDFEDAPEAFSIYNDIFLIATYENFYIVKNFKKEIILKETFWRSLYPNSIAAFDEKNVFIGIRGGVIKLDITDKTFKFYKYNG